MSRLRDYVERLLDPDVAEEQLPADEDEVGRLTQSLQRTAPRIRELVESLKLEGARREAILASMVEGVLAVDRDLRVTFCNHSFARTIGARIPVNQGMPLLELVRNPGLLEIMTKVLVTGQRVERRLKLPAAQEHTFEVLAGPLAGPRRAARSPSCTTSPSWNDWNAFVKILSRMCRTNCGRPWPQFAVTRKHCWTARWRIRTTIAGLSKSS